MFDYPERVISAPPPKIEIEETVFEQKIEVDAKETVVEKTAEEPKIVEKASEVATPEVQGKSEFLSESSFFTLTSPIMLTNLSRTRCVPSHFNLAEAQVEKPEAKAAPKPPMVKPKPKAKPVKELSLEEQAIADVSTTPPQFSYA